MHVVMWMGKKVDQPRFGVEWWWKDWGVNANWAQWRAFGASFGDGCADQCAGQFFMCMKNLRFRFRKNIKMVLI